MCDWYHNEIVLAKNILVIMSLIIVNKRNRLVMEKKLRMNRIVSKHILFLRICKTMKNIYIETISHILLNGIKYICVINISENCFLLSLNIFSLISFE